MMMIEKAPTRVIEAALAMVRQSGRGRLVVVKGPDRGESFVLGTEAMTLGSGAGSDALLSDPTVSRRHLFAELRDDGAFVRDLGSTNGSFVQGARFQELTLSFGAEVTIGQTVLKFVPEEEPIELAPADEEAFGAVVGRDAKLRRLFRLLGDVAATDATVMIEGETGTGKELFAEEIHRHSGRRDGPFVVFDCGAVPRELIESALFGHVRGAFTGAISDRRGAFVEANGGTLFLDEIGELAPEMQPALLRALDKRCVRPVGATAYEQVSVRVVAATNRNLRADIAARRFREDLYYRLAVIRIQVPPLRERPDDIGVLAELFVRQFCGERPMEIPAEVLTELRRHRWPGNVRELRNVIERACTLTHGTLLELDEAFAEPDDIATADAPEPQAAGVNTDLPFKKAKALVIDAFEREYIRTLLDRHHGNLSAAARNAEVDRKHFRELLRKHGLRETSD
jgi:DNA-binding NtrC family response regulator